MREIKFRAVHVNDNPKIMFYQEWSDIDNDMMMFAVGDKELAYKLGHVLYDDDFIKMQYTGKKDKNGVEIYEEDILKRTETRHELNCPPEIYDDYCIIEFNQATFRVRFLSDGEILTLDDYGADTGEIIGNTYESSGLLDA